MGPRTEYQVPDRVLLVFCALCPVLPAILNSREGLKEVILEKKYEVQSVCGCRLGYRLLQNISRCRLVRLHGCKSLHIFLGRHTFLLPIGMYSYTKLGIDVSFILKNLASAYLQN